MNTTNYRYTASRQNTKDLCAALQYVATHKAQLFYMAGQGDELAADLLAAFEGAWSYRPSDVARFIELHQGYIAEREAHHA